MSGKFLRGAGLNALEEKWVEGYPAPRIKWLLPAGKTRLIRVKLKKLRLDIKNSLFRAAVTWEH
ncbi:hypothetical protein H6F73_08305 [Microcoleus sp. FACHB-68]|nr:hypothetical protein [Microcoleus sp. FACHB-68]